MKLWDETGRLGAGDNVLGDGGGAGMDRKNQRKPRSGCVAGVKQQQREAAMREGTGQHRGGCVSIREAV